MEDSNPPPETETFAESVGRIAAQAWTQKRRLPGQLVHWAQSAFDTLLRWMQSIFSIALLLVWVSIIPFLLWLYSDYLPFQSEVTVYRAWCSAAEADGRCPALEETANPTTYLVSVENQSIIYWTWNNGSVSRLANCAVRNVNNWTCREPAPTFSSDTVDEMVDGAFHEESGNPYISTTDKIFPIVSKRHWWRVWLRQKLSFLDGSAPSH